MATTFPLKLITPTGIVFEGDVQEVTAVGGLGQFGVLAQHINMIAALAPCVLEIELSDDASRYYVVSGGLVEVTDGAMTVLAESVEEPGSIDRATVETALHDAEAKIAGMSAYAPEYEDASNDLMLARARLEATELSPATR